MKKILKKYASNPERLMDILIDIQDKEGFISSESIKTIASKLKLSVADVEQTVSFYHFFKQKHMGKYTVYLNNSAVADMMGRAEIQKAFENESGCKFGSISEDGLIGLYHTSCIGMNDQEPAALINGQVFTKLTAGRVKEIVEAFRNGTEIGKLKNEPGEGMNNSEFLKAEVSNNIRRKGEVIFSENETGAALKKITAMSSDDVINTVKLSQIRGRGGAGFPTGLKWAFCKKNKSDQRYIFCNADEGEPGTFKDRVILTERPELVFEGMTIAGYAVEATKGILYIRYEYRYMKDYLENVLKNMREKNLLGKNIAGKKGFNFDIRIQFGAGAYVCGEESALIESAEGKRGEPRDRPPFPVEKGYLDKPTVVNNVETLCSVVKVFNNSPEWYKNFGTKESSGTKVLSISGDCKNPGVYEIEWGFNISKILEMSGAENTQAVQVSGPSGTCIGSDDFDRELSFEDLSTGGSIIIIGKQRNLLNEIVKNFIEFFIEESCGSCVPCRAMTTLYKNNLEKILDGRGVQTDLDDMIKWGKTMLANRCGLGHAAANPVLTTIKNFSNLYSNLIQKDKGYDRGFDFNEAVKASCAAAGRTPLPEGDSNE